MALKRETREFWKAAFWTIVLIGAIAGLAFVAL
jgi:hypothetical protein